RRTQMTMADRAYEALGLERLQGAVEQWTRPKRRSFLSRWDNWFAIGLIALPAALALAYRPRQTDAAARRRIRDVMIDKVLTVDASATLREAAALMLE